MPRRGKDVAVRAIVVLGATALALAALGANASSVANSIGREAVPVGHRLYTYQQNDPSLAANFNNNATSPAGQAQIVNAYGGWVARELTALTINCSDSASHTGSLVMINNTFEQPVVVLQCRHDKCTHTGPTAYIRCQQNIPVEADPSLGMQATLLLAADVEWIDFVYNSSFDQECWPGKGGFPRTLKLPMDSVADCQETVPLSTVQMARRAAAKKAALVQLSTGAPMGRLRVSGRGTAAAASASSLPGTASWGDKYAVAAEPFDGPFSDLGAYARAAGVHGITAVVDGRMDLCAELAMFNMSTANCGAAPDLRNATAEQITDLALSLAARYCDPQYKYVFGIQLDLEPFGGDFKGPLVSLIAQLSAHLRDKDGDLGCVDSDHPYGRALSLFSFAEDIPGSGLREALGENGYVVISGYDLYPEDDSYTANSPSQYKAKLAKQLAAAKAAMSDTSWGHASKFSVGIPIAASTHEYETYTPSQWHCGKACVAKQGYPQVQYVDAAFDVLEADPFFDMGNTTGGYTGQFVGLSLWLFGGPNATVEYPPKSGNIWSPANPTPEVLQTLRERLPNLHAPATSP